MEYIYKQKTLNSNILLKGIGIHTGNDNVINLRPKETRGITFHRDTEITDLSLDNISNTFLSTDIDGIKTIEHLLSVLNIFEITNLDVEVIYGKEIPIYDGCSNIIYNMINDTGIKELDDNIKYIIKKDTIEYTFGDTSYIYKPMNDFLIKCEYKDKLYTSRVDKEEYLNNISTFKTFCKYEDIDKLRTIGYGQGGNKHNTVLYDPYKDTDEYVKHKILDFIGDLYTIGYPLRGYFKVKNPNHYSNNLFMEELSNNIRSL